MPPSPYVLTAQLRIRLQAVGRHGSEPRVAGIYVIVTHWASGREEISAPYGDVSRAVVKAMADSFLRADITSCLVCELPAYGHPATLVAAYQRGNPV